MIFLCIVLFSVYIAMALCLSFFALTAFSRNVFKKSWSSSSQIDMCKQFPVFFL
jgi:hypothetical protein